MFHFPQIVDRRTTSTTKLLSNLKYKEDNNMINKYQNLNMRLFIPVVKWLETLQNHHLINTVHRRLEN